MQPFAIDVKGGGKARNRRKSLLKEARQGRFGGSIGLSVDVLPSMPKGETVGNVVIDGKGAQRSSIRQGKKAG